MLWSRHLRHDHPVLAAGHPGRVGLQERADHTKVECAPTSSSFALVKAGTPPTADPTAAPLPTNRADCGDDRIGVLIELHLLDHGALDAEQPCPTVFNRTPSHLSAGPASDSRNRNGGAACSHIEAIRTHGSVTRAPKVDTDAGRSHWTLDTGHWTPDTGHGTRDTDIGHQPRGTGRADTGRGPG